MPASLTRWVTSLKVALNPGSAPVLCLGESEAQGHNRIRFWEIGRGKNDQMGFGMYEVFRCSFARWKSWISCTAGEQLGLYPVVRRRGVG